MNFEVRIQNKLATFYVFNEFYKKFNFQHLTKKIVVMNF